VSLTFESTAKTVEVDSFDVTYHEAGEGPTLVMLHGGGAGATGWSNFKDNFATFASRFHTILFNQPGFGGTGYPEKFDRHYLSFAADLLAGFLDVVGVEQTHLLGNSLGAAVTARFALDHPTRLHRVVLMGTGSALSVGLFAARPSEGIVRLNEFTSAAEPTPAMMEAFLRTLVHHQELITPELVAERFEMAVTPEGSEGTRALLAGYHDPRWAGEGELWRIADRITHETLITWGREDRVQPLDGAFLAMRLMPNARLHIIPNCGHWAQVDAKDEFERVAMSFLCNAPL
jgi:4,5:9,10-diseco-3-hydroxy-5,9,17-trioxoandrosta-1(10),2-diene-4-oate hydrolase